MDAAAADTIVGHVDGFRRGQLEGWAWRPGRPQDKVIVEILIDGELQGETAACINRPDLGIAGIGHGSHGFVFPLTLGPDRPGSVRITVRARGGPVLEAGEFDFVVSPERHFDGEMRVADGFIGQVFGSARAERPAPVPAAPMHFVLYAAQGGVGAAEVLGLDAYSYVFVLRGYRQLLRKFGIVHVVTEPEAADRIHANCMMRGENCLLLAFTAPQAMPMGLRCPTVPVIAWEFGAIPTGRDGSDRREDWRFVLRQTGRALTISHFAARAIRAEMGAQYPVMAVPTPVADRIGMAPEISLEPRCIPSVQGFIWDSREALTGTDDALPAPPTMPTVDGRAAAADDRWLDLAQASVAAERRKRQAARHAANPAASAGYEEHASTGSNPAPAPAVTAAATINTTKTELKPALSWRRRAGATAYFAREWYRVTVRDLVPAPFRALLSRLGGAAAVLVRRRKPQPTSIDLIEPALPAWVEAAAVANVPATRRLPADDAAPFAPPEPAWDDPATPGDKSSPASGMDAEWPSVTLDGVVFASVFSPRDGRKNWQDIVSAFATAFREQATATLVLKMVGADANFWWWDFQLLVRRLPAFRCRIVVLNGFLDDEAYGALIGVSHFVVNASLAEGQCLPLVEFMAAGRPAIAPRHSAMLDYIAPENAIIVASSPEFCASPHDPRSDLLLSRHRVDWQSLHDAFTAAYHIARLEPARYAAMAKAASDRVRAYCSDAVLGPKLAAFLGLGDDAVRRAGWQPIPRDAAEALLAPVTEAELLSVASA